MQPRELTHQDLLTVMGRVAAVTGCREFVIGGRGALVVACASPTLLATVDFDIGITIEGERRGMDTFEQELGAASPFAAEHGFYIEHAGAEMLTFVLPEGWQSRAARFEAQGVTALCLAPVDVALNKLHAKRPKDIEHLVLMIREGVISVPELETAIAQSPYSFLVAEHRRVLAQVMERLPNSQTPP
jgi:hypothetical protein